MGSFIKDIIPEGVRLSDTHEYALIDDEEDRVRVGISHYAAESLGDIVFVELPDVGTTLEQGDTLGSIESVKAASDLYAPVSGEVVAVNTMLEEEPEQVNDDCYGDGWIVEIVLSKPSELESLKTPEEYFTFLEESK